MVSFKSVPFKRALPEADPLEGRMFRNLADTLTVTGMSRDEIEQEMITLASTLARTSYHRRQFAWIVVEAKARYEAHAPHILFDQIAKYVAFEAAAFLSGARSFIDGIFHVARRRGGATLDEIEDVLLWQAMTNPQSAAYNLPELAILRARKSWYDALNLYRNVLVHVGGADSLAFYPPGVTVIGVERSANVMLLPDQASLKMPLAKKRGKRSVRTTRPHEWTYRTNMYLDAFIKESHDGLLGFAREVGQLWGASLPRRGIDERIDAVVLR